MTESDILELIAIISFTSFSILYWYCLYKCIFPDNNDKKYEK